MFFQWFVQLLCLRQLKYKFQTWNSSGKKSHCDIWCMIVQTDELMALFFWEQKVQDLSAIPESVAFTVFSTLKCLKSPTACHFAKTVSVRLLFTVTQHHSYQMKCKNALPTMLKTKETPFVTVFVNMFLKKGMCNLILNTSWRSAWIEQFLFVPSHSAITRQSLRVCAFLHRSYNSCSPVT